jgi:branched-chain amino acid transport system substrate-binding protein
LKVGFTYPSNAALQLQGYQMTKGYIYWAMAANGAGILSSNGTRYDIQLMGYDDHGNASLTDFYYRRLVLNDTVDFLLGPYASSLTQVANAAANSLGRLIVFGSGVAENLFSFGYPMIFGVSTTALHYTTTALSALQELGAQNVSIIYGTATFSGEVVNGTLDYITQNKMTLLGEPILFQNTSDSVLLPILTTIKSLNPDVFISAGLLADGESIVLAAKKVGFRPKAFYLTSTPSEIQFIQDLQQDAQYIIGPSQWYSTLPFTDNYYGSASNYAATFMSRLNESMVTYNSAEATAAGLVLQMGIERATNLTQQGVASAISNIKTKTFFGPIQFNSAGENIAKDMFTVQILNDNIAVVAPKLASTKSFVYPIPWPPEPSSQGTITSQSTSQSICPGGCNGDRGNCVNGACVCVGGYTGADCAQEISSSSVNGFNWILMLAIGPFMFWS